jgi:trans-aconitate 2-methyltransferase
MAWDPEIYLRFGAERTRPAGELLARIMPSSPPNAVADIGCGPGNSTELLAMRWPLAALDGMDSSAEMLETAARSAFKARWIKADVATWQPDKTYDVLFANAILQWVDDHRTLLPRLMSFLNPDGVFAFQMPRNFKEPCHTLMRKVADEGPWADKLRNVRDWSVVREPDEYYDMLSPLSANVDIWETEYLQVLDGENPVYRWLSGTGLRPFANALDEGEERDEFLRRYAAETAKAYPQRTDGKTLYPFKRLFVVAKKD